MSQPPEKPSPPDASADPAESTSTEEAASSTENMWGEVSAEVMAASEEAPPLLTEKDPDTDEVEIVPEVEESETPSPRNTTLMESASTDGDPSPTLPEINPWGDVSDDLVESEPETPKASPPEMIDDWGTVDGPGEAAQAIQNPIPGGFSDISPGPGPGIGPTDLLQDLGNIAAPQVDQRVFAGRFEEPFSLPNSAKVGIIGGKGTGKSYLFQAMVYRTYSGRNSGALSMYLHRDSVRVFKALKRTDIAQSVDTREFLQQYERWIRLDQTLRDTQCWYKLRLRYRNGFLGLRRSSMDVDFFDASGEGLAMKVFSDDQREVWKGYSDARVMVFCLPLWAAFPRAEKMTDDDWRARDEVLKEFSQVVTNYQDCRRENRASGTVQTILAFTMADDDRGALLSMRDKWIDPFLLAPAPLLKKLRRGSGVSSYLDNARKVSRLVLDELEESGFPEISRIPGLLDFGGGSPWVIPLSAVNGQGLVSVEKKFPDPADRPPRLHAPVPVHVELPLLVALCDRHNALM